MTEEFPEDDARSSESEAIVADLDSVPVADVAFAIPPAGYESVVTDAVTSLPVEAFVEAKPHEVVEAINAIGTRLERKLDELQSLFDREIRAEATREKVVDRLHAELQEYKQDLLLSVMRPVFIDLIQLHDDIGKVAVVPADDGGGDRTETRRLITLMEGFQQGIEDILYRQGVEPFQVDGEAFDPRRQRAVATVVSDEPALSKTVAARHRKGFRAGERVIRAEVVSVYALKK